MPLAKIHVLEGQYDAAAGVSPDDLFILIHEIPGENVSFGQIFYVDEFSELHAIPRNGKGLSPNNLPNENRQNGTIPGPRAVRDAVTKNGHRQVV